MRINVWGQGIWLLVSPFVVPLRGSRCLQGGHKNCWLLLKKNRTNKQKNMVNTKKTTKERVGCGKKGNCCVKSMLLCKRSMRLPYATHADCTRKSDCAWRKWNKNSSANGTSGQRIGRPLSVCYFKPKPKKAKMERRGTKPCAMLKSRSSCSRPGFSPRKNSLSRTNARMSL